MDRNDITARVKRAVRQWADLSDQDRLAGNDVLEELRPGYRDILLTRLLESMSGAPGFPISPETWASWQPSLTSVDSLIAMVRDQVGAA